MARYAAVLKTNDWDRFGSATNVREETLLETDDLIEAFAATHCLSVHRSVGSTRAYPILIETGEQLFLRTLFAEMCPEEYALIDGQDEDGNLSINLDAWFTRVLTERDSPDFQPCLIREIKGS